MEIEFMPTDNVARATPPEPLKFNLPDWYKQHPNTMDGVKENATNYNRYNVTTLSTIKKCVPFLDFLTSGYLLKFSADILIDPHFPIEGNGFVSWRSPYGQEVTGHLYSQLAMPIDGRKQDYIKFKNHWMIKTPPGYSCLFMQPLHLGKRDFVMFPGIVDTDTYNDVIHFPAYINTTENFKISCGDPMMAVFPFKRDQWKMKIAKEDFVYEKSSISIKNAQYFNNVYRNFVHSKKKYD